MPYSSDEGKAFIKSYLGDFTTSPNSFLDVGVGSGTYADLLKPLFKNAYWHGVEVWMPYVAEFELTTKYDALVIADAREYLLQLSLSNASLFDVVILGDIVEHMSKEDALILWHAARVIGDTVIMSLPIVHYPQGAEHSNPYETHVVDDWTHDKVLNTFFGFTSWWVGNEIGVYIT